MIILLVVALIALLGINFFVVAKTKSKILTEEQAKELEDVDCILVLGAGIWGQKPSPMLEDRLLQGISLYQNGVSQKIIMSGDHGSDNYDEVNVISVFHHTPKYFREALDLISTGKVDVEKLITKKMQMKYAKKALEMHKNGEAIKVLLEN